MNVTLAGRADFDTCAELIRQFYGQEPGLSPLTTQESSEKAELIFKAMGDKAAYLHLLGLQGRHMGYALIVPYFSSEYGGTIALLDELFISGECQGQGLGGKFLDWLKDWCARSGMKRLQLEVTAENTRVSGFYERNGFTLLNRQIMMMVTDTSGA